MDISSVVVTNRDAAPRGAASPPFPDPRRLFDAQRAAFMRQPPGFETRRHALYGLEQALLTRQDEIVAAVAADFGGRAAEETRALEVFPVLNEIRHACRRLRRWMAPQRVGVGWPFWPAAAQIVHQPLGVIGILSPWNYPFFLTLTPLVNVLAAGNHAIVKPSELAPASAALMTDIVSALFPPEYVAVLTGGAELAMQLTALPFDHLVFTGSTRIGRQVMKAASENLVPVTLELGGKSPAIVHADYPIERAAERILIGKLYNAGQTCVAPDYLLVPRRRRDEFVDAARHIVPRMFPSLATGRDYTHIINPQHYQRLQTLLDDARHRGATVIPLGGGDGRGDATTCVCPPTLLTNVGDDMAIMQEEIFGPLLPMVEYDQLDHALAYVNARPRPLALYYFDDDRARVDLVLQRTVTGGVTINDCLFHVGQAGLPFGGVGPSGMGRYHGVHGFRTFSNAKGVLLQRRWSPLALLRPPYTARTSALLRLLIR